MGIFDRVSRLLRANVNDALDNAEDPEKMLDQLIRDMTEELRGARSGRRDDRAGEGTGGG